MSRRRFMDRPNDLPSLDAKYDSESGNYYVNGSSSQVQTTGKNLIDLSEFNSFEKLDNGLYTTTKYYLSSNEVTYYLKPNTTYIISSPQLLQGLAFSHNGEWVNTNYNPPKFTTDSTGVAILKAGASSYPEIGNWVGNIQLEEGTVATEYEPYSNGIPSPSPDYPQPIIQNIPAGQYMVNVKSENLLKPLSTPKSDTSYWYTTDNYCTPLENGWIRIDCDNMEGQSTAYADFWSRMEAMPRIKPNTTYKIVLEIKNFNFIGNSAYLALFDTDTNVTTPWTGRTLFYADNGILKNDKKVFSKKTRDILPNNDVMTRNFVGVTPNTKINFDVRLSIYEENSTIETYQPYIEPQTHYVRLTDSLKSLSASIYDKIWINPNSKSKWIERKIAQDLFDGSENWEFFTDKNKTFRCYMGQIIDMDRPGYNERFKLIGPSSFDIENGFYDIYSNAYIISLITVDSVEDFKQWLLTHNLTAQYQIQTPIIEDL